MTPAAFSLIRKRCKFGTLRCDGALPFSIFVSDSAKGADAVFAYSGFILDPSTQ
jgi:hypothetical protein